MEVETYLKRIDIDEIKHLDLETLQTLQYQHMTHVPFENLDVIRNIPIELDVDAFYEKVVHHHRGGFCYELNGLYFTLLQKLGFDCELVSATIHRPDGTWARKGSHACTIVSMDGKAYLTDVGFGDSSMGPVPFSGEIHRDVSGSYYLHKADDKLYDLRRKRGDNTDWRTVLRIDITPMRLEDFTDACTFNQTSPGSPFTQKDLATIATPVGRITLSGDSLTTTSNGDKHETTIRANEKKDVLEQYFQIRDVSTGTSSF